MSKNAFTEPLWASPMKFCIDCKHYVAKNMCYRKISIKLSLVTGVSEYDFDTIGAERLFCNLERSIVGDCGEAGKFWEGK
jgi:hypothetical protein